METSQTVVQVAPARSGDVIILLVCLAIIVLALVLNVSGDGDSVSLTADGSYTLPPTCMLRATTGLPCPSCGLTRSFIAMAHLDIAAAWHLHHVGPGLFLFVLLQLPYRTLRLTWPAFHERSERFDLRINASILLSMVGLLIVNWIIVLILLLRT
jgi:hypothetical protein